MYMTFSSHNQCERRKANKKCWLRRTERWEYVIAKLSRTHRGTTCDVSILLDSRCRIKGNFVDGVCFDQFYFFYSFFFLSWYFILFFFWWVSLHTVEVSNIIFFAMCQQYSEFSYWILLVFLPFLLGTYFKNNDNIQFYSSVIHFSHDQRGRTSRYS